MFKFFKKAALLLSVCIVMFNYAFAQSNAIDTSASQSICEEAFFAQPGESVYCICYAEKLAMTGLTQSEVDALAEYARNSQIPSEVDLIKADQQAQLACSPF